ncbi:MAG: ABC transporter ATP-binding protein [Bacteroidetes bacterium]|nr:ABC transporter ATP-binding protein [Bacteroidota bacterium]
MIKIKNLYKSYKLGNKDVPVLKNLNLEIKKGEFVALTGESGSGKSTLLNIIGMLDYYNQGEYYLQQNNKNLLIKNFDENKLTELRNKYIGFIFQSFHLIPFKSALENVALPLYYRRIEKDKRLKIAMEILDRVGLKEKYNNLPNELSGGQKQRVSIARALVTNPPILLADEPTGALDSKTSKQIIDLIKELHKEDNKTVILVTHETSIAKNCQRNIKLVDGEIK